MKRKRVYNLKWDKLDNTAQLFPVIAREGMSNVYRVAVTLKEDIDETTLQIALEKVLPHFDVFRMTMKRGIFWYYFEENKNKAPRVKEEYTYPCMFINQYSNNNYLFRLSYYKNRINLEVFHALTDGNGALTFLKEITYQYLRLKHNNVLGDLIDSLGVETSLDTSDSYISNYRKKQKKSYKTKRAVIIKGEKLPINQFAIIHGTMPVDEIKKRLSGYADKLLSYPNYIGTIQSFIDRFVTLPYLRRISGQNVQAVDNRTYSQHMLNRMQKFGKYRALEYVTKGNFETGGQFSERIDHTQALHLSNGALFVGRQRNREGHA